MRAGGATLIVLSILVMVALPAPGHAQSPTATRGAFGMALSTGATAGALRGALPEGATVGAARGSLPAAAVIGAVRGALPPGGTVGAFRSALAADTVSVLPGASMPMATGTFRGDVPANANVGTASTPLPPGTQLGEPGAVELAQRLKAEARMNLIDGSYARAEGMLNRSVAIREEMVGRVRPEIAEALDENAKLLRRWDRNAAAADMEGRAKEIRTKLEPPAPKKPERF